MPTSVFTQGLSLNQLSQASDCFLWSGPPRPVSGSLNLQPLVDADARFPLADYPPALLAAYQNEQGLTGLPYTLRQQALHVHQEAFAAVSQPLPTADWTPEQFLAAAKATTSGNGPEKRYGYVPYTGPLPDMLFFIRQFGGTLFTGSGSEQRATFSDPQVLAAINWYLDLARVHGVTPPLATLSVPDGGGSQTAMQLVRNGQAAMWLGQTALMAGEPGKTPFTEGMAPLPLGRAGLQGEDLWVESLHISASSPVASQCWAWLSFLAQRGDMLLEPGVLPARRSVQEDALASLPADLADKPLLQAQAAALQRSGAQLAASTPPLDSPAMSWFIQAMQAVILNDADPQEALAKAQESTNRYLECVARSNDAAACQAAVK